MATFLNYYEILGVNEFASNEEIRENYRKIIKQCRPKGEDRNNITQDTLKVMAEYANRATEAYNILIDPSKRTAYNKVYERAMIGRETRERERERERKRRQEEAKARGGSHLKENVSPTRRSSVNGTHVSGRPSVPMRSSSTRKTGKHEIAKPDAIDYLNYAGQVTADTLKRMGQEYKETRREEKANPYSKRHDDREAKLNKTFNIDARFEDRSQVTPLRVCKGTAQVFWETFYQIGQLVPKKKETTTKYVIRNRRRIAGIIVAGAILTGTIGKNSAEPVDINSTSEPAITQLYEPPEATPEPTIVINCYHKVEDGEYLAMYSEASHTSIEELKEINDIEEANKIYPNTTLKIPYVIKESEIELYRTPITVNNQTVMSEGFARGYETDMAGLLALNEGRIQAVPTENGTTYRVTSNYIYVPNFLSLQEYREVTKNTNPTYTPPPAQNSKS